MEPYVDDLYSKFFLVGGLVVFVNFIVCSSPPEPNNILASTSLPSSNNLLGYIIFNACIGC